MDLFLKTYNNWQNGYCAGEPIPLDFRREATQIFQNCFNAFTSFLEVPNKIYRIFYLEDEQKLKTNDNMYYSFSSNLEGVQDVANKDKNLSSDLFLLVCKPNKALNVKKIVDDCYIGKNRFSNENEILSFLNEEDILELYFLKNRQDILNYKNKGIEIKLQDIKLTYKKIKEKYKIKE